MRKNLSTCNFPNFLPAPQIFFLHYFSYITVNLGGFGGAFKENERRKYIFQHVKQLAKRLNDRKIPRLAPTIHSRNLGSISGYRSPIETALCTTEINATHHAALLISSNIFSQSYSRSQVIVVCIDLYF